MQEINASIGFDQKLWRQDIRGSLAHAAMLAKIANVPVMEVIQAHMPYTLSIAVVVAIVLFLEGKLFKQDKDWTPEKAGSNLAQIAKTDRATLERVNYLWAITPMVPLAILIVTNIPRVTAYLPASLNSVTVLVAMLVGTALGMLVTRTNPVTICNKFFDGMGHAYGFVFGIIIAAGAFIAGLEAAGVLKDLIEAMKGAKSVVPLAGTFGPFVLAVLSGSGDAATLAFNNAVTPHAASFGIGTVNLGNLANIGGALGRSMSPVAAGCIIASAFAGISPLEIMKRNAVPMLIGALMGMLLLAR